MLAVQLVVVAINYLWLGGHESSRWKPRAKVALTSGQKAAISHLAERVEDLQSVKAKCCTFAEGQAELVHTKFDYCGEPIMSLEDLEADKVIPVWPRVGEAAVQDVVGYLPEDLRRVIEDPTKCLLPEWEWPERPPVSKVRATQDEWDRIVAAGYARGLMVAVRMKSSGMRADGRSLAEQPGSARSKKSVVNPRGCRDSFRISFQATPTRFTSKEATDTCPTLGN